MSRWRVLWGFAAVWLVLGRAAEADTVYLAGGRQLKGLVLEEYYDRILVSTAEGEKWIPLEGVEEIFYDEPEHNFLYLGRLAVRAGDLDRAQRFFERAARLNPELAAAREALLRVRDLGRKGGIHEFLDVPSELWDGLGLRIGTDDQDGRTVIQSVQSGGLSQAAGLKKNDALVRIFDETCRWRNGEDIAHGLIGPAGTVVIVTIERNAVYRPPKRSLWDWLRRRLPGASELEIALAYEGLSVSEAPPESDLKAGDRIIAISGRSTRHMPLDRARTLLQTGQEHVLTLQRTLPIERR